MTSGTALASVRVLGTGAYVPDRVVPNSELEASLGLEDGWIEQRTGIVERRFAADGEATSDLAASACSAALAAADIDAASIDLVVCATSTPDWPQPATAAAIHGHLGLRTDAGSVDVDAVCSGYVYALHMSAALVATDPSIKRALVVGADCYSRITDPTDRRTRVLFGDGAGAVVIERADDAASGVLSAAFGTVPSRIESLVVPAGGSRTPLDEQRLAAGLGYFAMHGPDVRDFALEHMPHALATACTRANVVPGDLDVIVPHQSNLRILEQAIVDAGIDPTRVPLTVATLGNTAAASIPITLDHAVRSGMVERGSLVGLVGYGGGLSWAAMLLRWS
jgi:3-oxoacyl-[acyl-carrier-protein] synthase-3